MISLEDKPCSLTLDVFDPVDGLNGERIPYGATVLDMWAHQRYISPFFELLGGTSKVTPDEAKNSIGSCRCSIGVLSP